MTISINKHLGLKIPYKHNTNKIRVISPPPPSEILCSPLIEDLYLNDLDPHWVKFDRSKSLDLRRKITIKKHL